MANTAGLKPPWPKGKSGNPGGRPKVLPVVQEAIDYNRSALKALIMDNLNPEKMQEWIQSAIKSGIKDGDVLKFKMLLELALGKVVEEPPEFPLSEEEKLLVLEFRRRKAERAIAGGA